MSRLQIYVYVVLPLAFRVSLPALNDNLVNLVKTTTQAIVIAVPELLYQLVSIYNDYSTSQNACMLLMFVQARRAPRISLCREQACRHRLRIGPQDPTIHPDRPLIPAP